MGKTKSGFDQYYDEAVEPGKRERAYAWATAIGLQDVDGLKPSKHLIATARRHIEGEIELKNRFLRIGFEYGSRGAESVAGLHRLGMTELEKPDIQTEKLDIDVGNLILMGCQDRHWSISRNCSGRILIDRSSDGRMCSPCWTCLQRRQVTFLTRCSRAGLSNE